LNAKVKSSFKSGIVSLQWNFKEYIYCLIN
jgi:hypothetical protein